MLGLLASFLAFFLRFDLNLSLTLVVFGHEHARLLCQHFFGDVQPDFSQAFDALLVPVVPPIETIDALVNLSSDAEAVTLKGLVQPGLVGLHEVNTRQLDLLLFRDYRLLKLWEARELGHGAHALLRLGKEHLQVGVFLIALLGMVSETHGLDIESLFLTVPPPDEIVGEADRDAQTAEDDGDVKVGVVHLHIETRLVLAPVHLGIILHRRCGVGSIVLHEGPEVLADGAY
mmetsp:Transcript_9628/g.16174  ORF Transcript_9628/g.16174 Transcript_9628/m.16174 type:complete len:231 (+) Transcript_9628:84-776(+)|eukprot:CAMPEP_0168611432 /NCGR_PEP_ID=MMETSP0449_2-20121227/2356_1 /TAXON_ID=1082188 /ORGANISM="Strombidium rassoulzadegani, Strain ras09" /LENGTH=230 /DNA_ID=CAMNT_0008651881 /DNA_START=39 /DNA_END=731 /DNA_ORIENTATION=-